MDQLPESVVSTRLETEFEGVHTIHTYRNPIASTFQGELPERECWVNRGYLGQGTYGSVWLEECVKGQRMTKLRAVKKIPIGIKALENRAAIRELETIVKFSAQEVSVGLLLTFIASTS